MTSADHASLRETIETLAAIERPACSPGEREAAEWIAGRLREAGCEAAVEEELAHPGYARHMTALGAAGVASGIAALRGRRALGAIAATAVAAAVTDDISNGPRLVRRLLKRRPTWNVVATAGDHAAPRTLVLLAHHDAAPTGIIFNPAPQRRAWERFPRLIESHDTSLPLWWIGVGASLAVAAGALLKRRALVAAGTAVGALGTASMADIARSPTVPGANDNLSGVATLIEVAHALQARPIDGLRVLLVSCGAEEVLQGGIHGFADRHFRSLAADRTWFLNLETVGSPRLAMLEGEGPVWMEDQDPELRDLVANTAATAGIDLRRGLRSRSSTDTVVPHRAGYPVVTLTSITPWKSLANYHWPTDTPENVDYDTVGQAVRLVEAVAGRLA